MRILHSISLRWHYPDQLKGSQRLPHLSFLSEAPLWTRQV